MAINKSEIEEENFINKTPLDSPEHRSGAPNVIKASPEKGHNYLFVISRQTRLCESRTDKI